MKILLVEDDDEIAASLCRGLGAEGLEVTRVADGLDGYWHASEHYYDLVLLDILLPGRNGFEVCRELRAAGVWTPILMLTAKDGELDQAEALDTGADDYLVKPFSYPVLLARIRALHRRTSQGGPAPVEAGDLRVDPLTRRCWRGGTEITLTSREHDILTFLLRRRGAVVSKRQLLDGIWDAGFDGDPNIVEVYVGRLRRKVDEPFARHALETVRGAGYRVAADGG